MKSQLVSHAKPPESSGAGERARRGAFGAVLRPVQAFVRLEAASGILLLACALAALAWANLHPSTYRAAFDYPLTLRGEAAHVTVRMLINDGLMVLFFFVVGMEIKRELAVGELNTVGNALMPAIAALGGMVVPAAVFLAFNWSEAGRNGWGIPIATDIAFCVGILTLLKNRVPRPLLVFVTALAVFDDIGGILVIAIWYGHGLNWAWLLGAVGLLLILLAMNRAYVASGAAYACVGAGLWYALHHGGIHATIAGVLLGLAIPARPPRPSREVLHELTAQLSELDRKPVEEEVGNAEGIDIHEKLTELQAPLQRLMRALHPLVAFLIMPIFALANSGVSFQGSSLADLATRVSIGAGVGLCAGKLLGVFGFTVLAAKLGLAPLPGRAPLLKVLGVSAIAGVGFTVALFVAALAYPEAPQALHQAKIGILFGSVLAGLCGWAILVATSKTAGQPQE